MAEPHQIIRQCADLFFSEQGTVQENIYRVAAAAFRAGVEHSGLPPASWWAEGDDELFAAPAACNHPEQHIEMPITKHGVTMPAAVWERIKDGVPPDYTEQEFRAYSAIQLARERAADVKKGHGDLMELIGEFGRCVRDEPTKAGAVLHEIHCRINAHEEGIDRAFEIIRAAKKIADTHLAGVKELDGRTEAMKEIISNLRIAAIVMENLPEQPGYNGSLLFIDDVEAEKVAKAINAAVAALEAVTAGVKGLDDAQR